MLDNETKRIGFGLSFVALISSTIGCLISFIMLILMIYDLYNNRLKRSDKITIILSMNIYINFFIILTIFIIMNIQTVLGDLYGQDFNSSRCIFLGYLVPTICFTSYNAFVNQAFFRLCRIVYSQYQWLQFFWLYIIIPPIQLILGCVLMSPLLIWNDVVYLPMYYYCYFQFSNLRSTFWTVFSAYGIPLSCLLFIYIRVTKFIDHQSNNQTLVIKRRQDRDLLVIRRIFMIVGTLLTAGIPGITLFIISIITRQEYSLSLIITFFSIAMAFTGLSVAMIFFTPQLKAIVLTRYQRNRIIPFGNSVMNSIPARIITNNP